MITQILKKAHLDRCRFEKELSDLTQGFLLRFRLKEAVQNRTRQLLYALPGTLEIAVQRCTEKEAGEGWGWMENYNSYPDADGLVPLLEATLYLDVPYHPERTEMKLGIPLALYDAVEKDLCLIYDGMHLWFLYDNVIINENFPYGTLKPATAAAVWGDNLAYMDFSADVKAIEYSQYTRTLDRSIRYYSPAGHSAWAGDVVNFFHEGVYHLFYLYDRHHHCNRWGGGVHYFYHMTTTDFINWVDHGPSFEIEYPWQAFGTGTPFYHDGKFWFAIGFHTSRSIPKELIYAPHIEEFYRQNGYTVGVDHKEIYDRGLYPSGANLMVSEDGFNYTPCNKMFHWAENPSVYSNADGTLTLCVGGGMWQAEHPEGPWKCVKDNFPPWGLDTPLHYSAECPSFFEKDGYKYLIMGKRGYWRTEKGGDEYRDIGMTGEDIYDGLTVPMVANCDGRLLLAGWMLGMGFGSIVVHRELIQNADGSLGMKWLPEDSPTREKLLYRSEKDFCFTADPKKAYYYELEVDAAPEGVLSVLFGDDCELRLDASLEEAQIGPIGGERILPPYLRTNREDETCFEKDVPHWGENFTLGKMDCLKAPYSLRILQYFDIKMRSTLIDVEIAGRRTLISNRVGKSFDRVQVVSSAGTQVRSMEVYAYEVEACR